MQAYVLQALLIRKDQIEYSRTRVIVQAMVTKANQEAVDAALKDYRDAQMPYLRRVQNDDRSRHIKKLMEEVARGPIGITPVMQKRVSSKLKTRVVQRTEEERLESSRHLSKKLGGHL